MLSREFLLQQSELCQQLADSSTGQIAERLRRLAAEYRDRAEAAADLGDLAFPDKTVVPFRANAVPRG